MSGSGNDDEDSNDNDDNDSRLSPSGITIFPVGFRTVESVRQSSFDATFFVLQPDSFMNGTFVPIESVRNCFRLHASESDFTAVVVPL